MIEFKYTEKDFKGNELVKVSFELPCGLNIEEVTQEFKQFLLAIGFQPETVRDFLQENK